METQTEAHKPNEPETKKETKQKTTKKPGKEAQLAQELNNQKDSYLRLCAEYDNFRKRSAKEKSETYALATANAAEGLLPVIDNFERAVSVQGENADEGLSLIHTQFKEYLSNLGVKEIEAEGKRFDPNFHIAVMHVEDDAFPENSVAEVFQKGYMLGDKVIRPACVKVAN